MTICSSPEKPVLLLIDLAEPFAESEAKARRFVNPRYVPMLKNECGVLCKNLGMMLRRDPLIKDLNGQVLADFEVFLTEGRSISQDWYTKMIRTFKRLWRHAANEGHVSLTEEAKPKPNPRRFAKNLGPDGELIRVSDAPGTLWRVALDEYFPRNIRVNSDRTIEQYRMSFRDFTEFLRRPPVLDDLTDDTLVGLTRHLLRKKLAATTINGSIGRIGALWTWLAKRRVVQTFPTFQKIPEPKRIPKAWSKNDLAKVLAACRSAPGWAENGVRKSVWWTALHLVLWDSGERIGAVLACRWEWLDLEAGLLRIPAEVRKGKSADAEYKLHETTLAWLKALRPINRHLIFGERKTASVYAAYKAIRKRAGVASTRDSAFHRMRRSVASHLHATGFNATDALQHSAESITRESYLDPAICGTVRPAEVLFRPEGSQEPPPAPAFELDESVAWL